MENELILVLDFGGQYKELIARRVRECGVLSKIIPGNTPVDKICEMHPIGMIMTGGPASVYAESSPKCSPELFDLNIPILGICYGHQLMSYLLGGKVEHSPVSEYGKTLTHVDTGAALFQGLEPDQQMLMSHTDFVSIPPEGFTCVARTADCPTASLQNPEKRLYSVQFHPEVTHSEHGMDVIRNFLFGICHAKADYTMDDYIETQIQAVRNRVGAHEPVLLALSGGVDSSVVAALLIKAVGQQLVCVHVNHGLLRKGEPEQVVQVFRHEMNANLVYVDATDRFLNKLAGVSDPEAKRKIIGAEFIRVFEEEARKLEGIEFLAQGTIYPDILESVGVKAHHNVGGLPEDLRFELVEPVKFLYKDEVRVVGKALGLPDNMVYRQPFPGPGLGVRCTGAITRDRLEALRESDAILREEFANAGLDEKVWQYFTVVPDFRSTGIRDGKRSWDWPVIIRAVNSVDATSATIEEIPYPLLHRITDRILAEVKGVNRVLYDLSPKPCATIEWE